MKLEKLMWILKRKYKTENTLAKKKDKKTKNTLQSEVATLTTMKGLKNLFLICENIKNLRNGYRKRIKKKEKKDLPILKEILILIKSLNMKQKEVLLVQENMIPKKMLRL